jgi:hypothetical protein
MHEKDDGELLRQERNRAGFRSLDADLSQGTRTEKKEELWMVNHNLGDGEIGFFN